MLTICVGKLLDVDMTAHLGHARRVLLVWDAHGLPIADYVLARLLPLLVDREHLVLMHDVSDNRYAAVTRDYGDKPFWRGQTGAHAGSTGPLNIGWLCFFVDQFLPVLDFLHRNGVELHSADHEMHTELLSDERAVSAVRDTVPPEFLSYVNHWAYFTLREAEGPLTFPKFLGSSFECGHESPRPQTSQEQRLGSVLRAGGNWLRAFRRSTG
jgi:hypothetical protein